MASLKSNDNDHRCRKCGHIGCDIRLVGCGCTMHAKCVPLALIIGERAVADDSETIPQALPPQPRRCNFCGKADLHSGIYMFPLKTDALERAGKIRQKRLSSRNNGPEDTNKATLSGQVRKRDDTSDENGDWIEAESFLMGQHTENACTTVSDGHHRTGRWTNEEMAFTDQLVNAFHEGVLPIPHGVKLNEFLGENLLCKSSRLTKKMKNAKLSTKSYILKHPSLGSLYKENYQSTTLSGLEEMFLNSVPCEATRLELGFNMRKQWRTHFSNLCLQVGYEGLDGRDWLSSLENMEKRAAQSEERIKKARRRRMGLALQRDASKEAPSGVFISGMPARFKMTPDMVESFDPQTVTSSSSLKSDKPVPTSVSLSSSTPVKSTEQEDQFDNDMLENLLGIGASTETGLNERHRSNMFGEDGSVNFDLDGDCLSPDSAPSNSDCGAFLNMVVKFMEKENLPFEHVDIWAPSFLNPEDCAATSSFKSPTDAVSMRLVHAGQATRRDLPSPFLAYQLNEYGEYSTNFSFAPGVGLPGRVYATGQISWESSLQIANPAVFERAGGAKVYGIKTALGLPVNSPTLGRVVVSMYSTKDLTKDDAVVEKCKAEMNHWCPLPRWELVIDVGNLDIHGYDIDPFPQTAVVATMPASAPAPIYPPEMRKMSQVSLGMPLTVESTLVTHANSSSSGARATSDRRIVCHDHTNNHDLSNRKPPITEKRGTKAVTTDEEEENQIADLLGDHMPLDANKTAESSFADGTGTPHGMDVLLPHFMSLRLLLLRSADRRSPDETDMIDIIKKSFRGYCKDNRRSGEALATLLAKDWMYLSNSFSGAGPSNTRERASPKNIEMVLYDHSNRPHQSNSSFRDRSTSDSSSHHSHTSMGLGPRRISSDAGSRTQRKRTISNSSESFAMVPEHQPPFIVSDHP
eukprot:scaffold134895_cov44-Attheya_sp.AAC.2